MLGLLVPGVLMGGADADTPVVTSTHMLPVLGVGN